MQQDWKLMDKSILLDDRREIIFIVIYSAHTVNAYILQ